MNSGLIQVLLADDDADDCLFFKEALQELSVSVNLSIVNDGEQLMKQLQKKEEHPAVIFLDLNMPRKNGFECLSEIKINKALMHLPIIVISTSFDVEIIKQLYKNGATAYIQKPNEFNKLKNVMRQALLLVKQPISTKQSFDTFVLQA